MSQRGSNEGSQVGRMEDYDWGVNEVDQQGARSLAARMDALEHTNRELTRTNQAILALLQNQTNTLPPPINTSKQPAFHYHQRTGPRNPTDVDYYGLSRPSDDEDEGPAIKGLNEGGDAPNERRGRAALLTPPLPTAHNVQPLHPMPR